MISVTSVAYLGVALLVLGLVGAWRSRGLDAVSRATWVGFAGIVLATVAFARSWGRDSGIGLGWGLACLGIAWVAVLVRLDGGRATTATTAPPVRGEEGGE